jgi:hypothetical protein
MIPASECALSLSPECFDNHGVIESVLLSKSSSRCRRSNALVILRCARNFEQCVIYFASHGVRTSER